MHEDSHSVRGTRDTTLGTITRVDVWFDLYVNDLSCDEVLFNVLINDEWVGTVEVKPGDVDGSGSFDTEISVLGAVDLAYEVVFDVGWGSDDDTDDLLAGSPNGDLSDDDLFAAYDELLTQDG